MRCFISIAIPEDIKKKMSAIQERMKRSGADVSWTKPDGMHLTLKFLGEIEEKRVAKIETAMNIACAGITPFSLQVSGIGVFPPPPPIPPLNKGGVGGVVSRGRHPRVMWIGLNENGNNLIKIQRGIEYQLEEIGFPAEKRRFSPHITLGRVRSNRNLSQLSAIMDGDRNTEIGGFSVSAVHLIKSDLRPEGALYTELYLLQLKGD
ncbi:MAG: RNA 2',3'-cyclic phosphodiesterase [Nitrospirae bacterium]|nr:RNA 2',3'-cyclic phosphodiesterase [Nitrospirota bacterium]